AGCNVNAAGNACIQAAMNGYGSGAKGTRNLRLLRAPATLTVPHLVPFLLDRIVPTPIGLAPLTPESGERGFSPERLQSRRRATGSLSRRVSTNRCRMA